MIRLPLAGAAAADALDAHAHQLLERIDRALRHPDRGRDQRVGQPGVDRHLVEGVRITPVPRCVRWPRLPSGGCDSRGRGFSTYTSLLPVPQSPVTCQLSTMRKSLFGTSAIRGPGMNSIAQLAWSIPLEKSQWPESRIPPLDGSICWSACSTRSMKRRRANQPSIRPAPGPATFRPSNCGAARNCPATRSSRIRVPTPSPPRARFHVETLSAVREGLGDANDAGADEIVESLVKDES